MLVPYVNVERHDAGGVKIDVKGPRLREEMMARSVITVVAMVWLRWVYGSNMHRRLAIYNQWLLLNLRNMSTKPFDPSSTAAG